MPTIEKLTERATPVPPETLGAAVFAHFKDFPDTLVIPVVKDDRPVGLIERNAFLLRVAGPFGHALYGNRPITELMDDEPSVVEAGVRIDSFCDAMLNSGPGALTRGFIVTRQGKYWGIGTVISLLKAINDDQRRQNTELTEQARVLSDTRTQALSAARAKSQFLSIMSHELRTPLNAIIGFSEVLKSELLGAHAVPQYKEYAGDIHASGQHLLTLINELLDLSRIEAGKYDLNEEAISLVDISDDCRRMLEIRARSKNVDLQFEAGDSLPKIWGDERAVRQVVLNLLSNAIKFTPQSGKIVLTVGRSTDGGQFISVVDNGPGIPEDEIETVLSSFGQGSLAQKTAEQGAGLGLPIVQKIMDLHQGRFDLFSKLRFGTEVIATFPRARVMEGIAPVVEQRNRLEIYSEAS